MWVWWGNIVNYCLNSYTCRAWGCWCTQCPLHLEGLGMLVYSVHYTCRIWGCWCTQYPLHTGPEVSVHTVHYTCRFWGCWCTVFTTPVGFGDIGVHSVHYTCRAWDIGVHSVCPLSGLFHSIGRALVSRLRGPGFKSQPYTVGGLVIIIIWGAQPG